jgi:hypothetical protein
LELLVVFLLISRLQSKNYPIGTSVMLVPKNLRVSLELVR